MSVGRWWGGAAAALVLLFACGDDDDGAAVAGSAGRGGGAAGGVAAGAGSAGATGGAGTGPSGAGGASGAPAAAPWLMGYYVGYLRDEMPPGEVPYETMTHLAVGAALPGGDGSLDTSFYLGASEGLALADDLVARAKAAGTKPILMVGGAGGHDGFVGAAGDANRAAFVANLVAFAQAHGFDGLDLDWEPIALADQAPLRALATELRAAWPGAILTLPVNFVNVNFAGADPWFAQVAPLFDQMNVMSYVMTVTAQGWQSWHSSALVGEGASTPTSVESSAQWYLDAGVPAAKLGVGAGFFGVCYSPPVDGPRQALNGSALRGGDNSMSYANIMADYYSETARRWDDAAKAPYLSFLQATGPEGCSFVSYEDEESLAAKGAFVAARGLGGAIVWAINQGHRAALPAGERDPLLRALANSLP